MSLVEARPGLDVDDAFDMNRALIAGRDHGDGQFRVVTRPPKIRRFEENLPPPRPRLGRLLFVIQVGKEQAHIPGGGLSAQGPFDEPIVVQRERKAGLLVGDVEVLAFLQDEHWLARVRAIHVMDETAQILGFERLFDGLGEEILPRVLLVRPGRTGERADEAVEIEVRVERRVLLVAKVDARGSQPALHVAGCEDQRPDHLTRRRAGIDRCIAGPQLLPNRHEVILQREAEQSLPLILHPLTVTRALRGKRPVRATRFFRVPRLVGRRRRILTGRAAVATRCLFGLPRFPVSPGAYLAGLAFVVLLAPAEKDRDARRSPGKPESQRVLLEDLFPLHESARRGRLAAAGRERREHQEFLFGEQNARWQIFETVETPHRLRDTKPARGEQTGTVLTRVAEVSGVARRPENATKTLAKT